MSWFDKLPAVIRHGLIAFTSAVLGDLGSAVVTAGGVQALAWPDAAYHALTAGVVAVVGALGLLSGTTMTRQYGLGSKVVGPSLNLRVRVPGAPVSLQPSIAPAPDGDTSPGMSGNP